MQTLERIKLVEWKIDNHHGDFLKQCEEVSKWYRLNTTPETNQKYLQLASKYEKMAIVERQRRHDTNVEILRKLRAGELDKRKS